MDTFVSALICEVCEEDFLLPTEPLGTMHKQRHVYFFKMRGVLTEGAVGSSNVNVDKMVYAALVKWDIKQLELMFYPAKFCLFHGKSKFISKF